MKARFVARESLSVNDATIHVFEDMIRRVLGKVDMTSERRGDLFVITVENVSEAAVADAVEAGARFHRALRLHFTAESAGDGDDLPPLPAAAGHWTCFMCGASWPSGCPIADDRYRLLVGLEQDERLAAMSRGERRAMAESCAGCTPGWRFVPGRGAEMPGGRTLDLL